MTFDQFDALPREVRDALNYATFKYSSPPVAPEDAKAKAARILACDARQIAASRRRRD